MKKANKKSSNVEAIDAVSALEPNALQAESGLKKELGDKNLKKHIEQSQIDKEESNELSENVSALASEVQSLDITFAHQAFEPESLDIVLTQNTNDGKAAAITESTLGTSWWLAGLGLLGIAAAAGGGGGGGGGGSAPGDTTAPTIASTNPADGAAAVAVGSNIVITFSESVQFGTSGTIKIFDANNNLIQSINVASPGANASINGSVLTINPSSDLASSSGYYIQITAGAIEDTTGNDFAGIANTTTLNFTTADVGAPTVETFSPEDESGTALTTANIVVTFTENIELGDSGRIELRKWSSSGELVQEFDVSDSQDLVHLSISGDQLTINPAENFDYDTTYYVVFISGAVTDTSGNPYAGTAAYDFSTEAPPSVEFRHADFNSAYLGSGSHNGGLGIRFNDRLEIATTDKAVVEVNLVSDEHVNDSSESGADYENVQVGTLYNDPPNAIELAQVIDFDDVENMETFRLNVFSEDSVRISLELQDLNDDEDFKRVDVNVSESSDLFAFDDVVRTHNFGTTVNVSADDSSLISADFHVVHVSSESVVSVLARDSSEIFGRENVVIVNQNNGVGGGDSALISVDAINNSLVHVMQSDDSDSIDTNAAIDVELVLVNGLSADIEISAMNDSKISADGLINQNLDDGESTEGHAYVVEVNQVLNDARIPIDSSDTFNVNVSIDANNGSSVWAYVTADIYDDVDSSDETVNDVTDVALKASVVSIDTYAGSIDGGSINVSLDASGSSEISAQTRIDVSIDVYGSGEPSLDAEPSLDTAATVENVTAYSTGVGIYINDVSGSMDAVNVAVSASTNSQVSVENIVDINVDTSTIDVGSLGGEDILVETISLDANVVQVWSDSSNDLDITSINLSVDASDSSDVMATNGLIIRVDQNGYHDCADSSVIDVAELLLGANIVDISLLDSTDVDTVSIDVSGSDSTVLALNSVDISLDTTNSAISLDNVNLDATVVNIQGDNGVAISSVDIDISSGSGGSLGAANALELSVYAGYENSDDINSELSITGIDMNADIVRIDSADIGALNISVDSGSGDVFAVNSLVAASTDGSADFLLGPISFGSSDSYIDLTRGQDATIQATLDASIIDISVDAESVQVMAGAFNSGYSYVTAGNQVIMDIESDGADSDQNVAIDLDASASFVNLVNSSAVYGEDGLTTDNSVAVIGVNSINIIGNAISIDLFDDGTIFDAAGYDVTIDANASLIDIEGANADATAYFAGALTIVANTIIVNADSEASNDSSDLDTIDIDANSSLISINNLGESGDVDARVLAYGATVVVSTDIYLDAYSGSNSLDTQISVDSNLISIQAADVSEENLDSISAGILSAGFDGGSGQSTSNELVLALTIIDTSQDAAQSVDSIIDVTQSGISFLSTSVDNFVDVLDLSNRFNRNFIDGSFDISADINGVVALDNSAIQLVTSIDSGIVAGDVDSEINVSSIVVNLDDVDAREIYVDVLAYGSSEIINSVSVVESITVDTNGDTISVDLNLESTLIVLDADGYSVDTSTEFQVVMEATDSSEISSYIDVNSTYLKGNLSSEIDVKNTGMSLDLQGGSSDARVATVDVLVSNDSQIRISTSIDIDHGGNFATTETELSINIEASFLSADLDFDGTFTANIQANDSSLVSVKTSLDTSGYSTGSSDISVEIYNTLVSIDFVSADANLDLTVEALNSSQIEAATKLDLFNRSNADDAVVSLDINTTLISLDAGSTDGSITITLNAIGSSEILVSADHSVNIRALSVDYEYDAKTHGISIDGDSSGDSLMVVNVSVDDSSDINVLTNHSALISADESMDISIDIESSFISIESYALSLTDDVLYDSFDDIGPSVTVSVDNNSNILVDAHSALNLSGYDTSFDADENFSIDAYININATGISIDADGAKIDLDVNNNSSFIVGASVSDDIAPNSDGHFDNSYDHGGVALFGDVTMDYFLDAHLISIDGDYSTINIDVTDSSELRAYTSYESNLDEQDATRGIYTHHVEVREDSTIINIDGTFSTITINVSDDSTVEAGSIISIDGWGNDITITAHDGSSIDAVDGDVVHIEYYATPDRSYDFADRQEFGNTINVTIDSSDLDANDDVIDVGAHSTDVNFLATNSAEIFTGGSLIKLNGKHQEIDVTLSNDASVNMVHDENMIEVIGAGATISLDMSFGAQIHLSQDSNLDDRNVIHVLGRYADVNVTIGDESADAIQARGFSLDASQDDVLISADDLIEIIGGNADVMVSIINNSGSLEFTDDFIEILGDYASVDLSIEDTNNVCVDDNLVIIEGDFSNTSISVVNSDIEIGTIAHISGDAYELSVYIDDSEISADDNFIRISSESSFDIHAGYVSVEIYHSSIDVDGDFIRVSGDDNHVNTLMHQGMLSVDGTVFDISGENNSVIATFVNVSTDIDNGLQPGYLVCIDGDFNDINLTLSEMSIDYSNTSVDVVVDIEGDDNKFELNLNDGSTVDLGVYVSGDDNSLSFDLNDESYLSLNLEASNSSGDDRDLDLAFNLERESVMDFALLLNSSNDNDYGDLTLDLTMKDGSRINGFVYLDEGLSLDFTSNVTDHDFNSHILFALNGSSLDINHMDTANNQNLDLRYVGGSAEITLAAGHNYDRIDIESSELLDVSNFGSEDTLLISGDSYSWQEVASLVNGSYDEWDVVNDATLSSEDAIFFYANEDDNTWSQQDLEDAVEDYDDSGDFTGQDIYFVVTGDFDDDVGAPENDVQIWKFDKTNDDFILSATLFNASEYFNDVSDMQDVISTGYVNDYFNYPVL